MSFITKFLPGLIPGVGAFANPWVLLAIGIAALSLYAYGRHEGATIERAGWATREAALNAARAKKVQELSDRYRDREREHAGQLADISADYQQLLRENDDEKNRVIAGLRDGTRKLYINAACPGTVGSGLSAPRAGAGGRDGETRAELSAEAAGFLVGEASRADAVTRQLAACQAVVQADRPAVKSP